MWHAWGTGELRTAFLWGKPEGHYFEDLEIDGRILLIRISKKWLIGVMDWLGLAEDRGMWGGWGATVKTMTNLRVSYNVENFLTS